MSTARGERRKNLAASREALKTLPLWEIFELPGRPHVVYMLRSYADHPNPKEAAEAARADVPFLFKAFETGQIGPKRMAKMHGGKPRISTIHEYLDWTVTAQAAQEDDELDFGGFRVLVLLPRYVSHWPYPGAPGNKEGVKKHTELGAPLPPLPVLQQHGRPLSAATIRSGPGYLEIPFVATHESKRGRGYCRCLLEAIEDIARVLQLPKLMLCSTNDPMVKSTWHHLGFDFTTEEQMHQWDIPHSDMVYLQNTTQMHKAVPPKGQYKAVRIKQGLFTQRIYARLDKQPQRPRLHMPPPKKAPPKKAVTNTSNLPNHLQHPFTSLPQQMSLSTGSRQMSLTPPLLPSYMATNEAMSNFGGAPAKGYHSLLGGGGLPPFPGQTSLHMDTSLPLLPGPMMGLGNHNQQQSNGQGLPGSHLLPGPNTRGFTPTPGLHQGTQGATPLTLDLTQTFPGSMQPPQQPIQVMPMGGANPHGASGVDTSLPWGAPPPHLPQAPLGMLPGGPPAPFNGPVLELGQLSIHGTGAGGSGMYGGGVKTQDGVKAGSQEEPKLSFVESMKQQQKLARLNLMNKSNDPNSGPSAASQSQQPVSGASGSQTASQPPSQPQNSHAAQAIDALLSSTNALTAPSRGQTGALGSLPHNMSMDSLNAGNSQAGLPPLDMSSAENSLAGLPGHLGLAPLDASLLPQGAGAAAGAPTAFGAAGRASPGMLPMSLPPFSSAPPHSQLLNNQVPGVAGMGGVGGFGSGVGAPLLPQGLALPGPNLGGPGSGGSGRGK